MKFSGGQDPIYLNDILEFTKGLKCKRDIPSQFLLYLSKLALTVAPYTVMIVKAVLSSPEKYVRNGVSMLSMPNMLFVC